MNFAHPSLDLTTFSQAISSTDFDSKGFLELVLNVIDGLQAVVCTKDLAGRYYHVNQYFEKATGVAAKDALGKTAKEVFSFNPRVAESIQTKDAQVIANKQVEFYEDYLPNSDGVYCWYYVNKAPMFNDKGEVIAVMCLAVDITKKKVAEEKLYAATQAKNTFLAKMSHEIRTPISAISGYLDLAKVSDEGTCRSYMGKMNNSVDHLLNLVDDILDLSSIEANKLQLNPKPFDVTSMLDSVVTNLTHRAEENNNQIKKDYESVWNELLIGDETRIKQIIFNLVSNAIKFSKNSKVTVRARISSSNNGDKDKLIVLVQDHGIGMASNKRNHIFKAFEQLDSSNHYFKGTGLGLSIVKELTEVMGGKVKIFSEQNVGTIVAVSLPLKLCNDIDRLETKVPNRGVTGASLKGKHICIVEDQPFNREILETILRLEGANTVSFQDGSDLVQAIEEQSLNSDIDCFLLDVHMPILSGPETLIKLRQYERFTETPAFIVTADAIKSNLEEYLAGNYNLSGIFIKPLKRGEITEALCNLPTVRKTI